MKSHPIYELLEEIGQGSSATVYRARDLALKRDVAIKELHEKYQRDVRQMEQFWQEAQFLAGVRHDSIVQIYGVDQERGWIVMELLQGGLEAKVAQGPLPADMVRSILRQILGALDCLHRQNKLHADIKPANLLINDQGRVKLSDSAGFKMGGEVRKPTGSSKYLPPELLNPAFGDVGPALDLYALGFTAVELLKGPAFDKMFKGVGENAIDADLAWMRWHSSPTEKLPPLAQIIPGIPADLVRVIERLLKKQVAERYPFAADALQDLEDRGLVLVEPAVAAPKQGKAALPFSGPAVAPIGHLPPAALPLPAAKALPAPKPLPAPKMVAAKADSKGKSWVSRQLEKKPVLWTVLAAILVPTMWYFFSETDEESPQAVAAKITAMTKGAKKDEPVKESPKVEIPVKETPKLDTFAPPTAFAKPGSRPAAVQGKSGVRRIAIHTAPAGAWVYVNGALQKNKTNGDYEVPAGAFGLKLVLDGHRVVEQRQIDLPPQALKLDPLAAQFHALLVGVHRYDGMGGDFLHAEQDIEALGRALLVSGYDAKNLTILTQTRGQKAAAARPTADHLRKTLANLAAQVNSVDTVVVMLAGRVVETKAGAAFAADGANAVQPATMLPLGDLFSAMKALPAKNKMLVLDGWRHGESKDSSVRKLTLKAEDVAGTFVLMNCDEGQTGFDLPLERHGLFLRDVARGLLGAADADNNHQVSGAELAAFVRKATSAQAAKLPGKVEQTPQTLGADSEGAMMVNKVSEAGRQLVQAEDYYAKKEMDQALKALDLAEKADGRLAEIHLRRVEVLYAKKDFAGALKVIDLALQRDDNLAEAHSHKGDLLLKLNRLPEALASHDRAVALEPNFGPGYLDRGIVHEEAKKVPQAIQDYTLAVEKSPNLAQAYEFRAGAYRKTNELAKAVADYKKVAELEPRRAALWNTLGATLADLKELDQAAVALKKAVEINPTYKVAYLNLGIVHLRAKNHDLAVDSLKQALALDANYGAAHYNLSKAYTELGRRDQMPLAQEHLAKAKELGFRIP